VAEVLGGSVEHREQASAKPPWRERARAFLRKHRRALPIAGIVLVVLFVAAVLLLRWLASFETTDDAQIDGNISAIGSRIAGTVVAVHVEDNQPVKPGDLLVEFDPTDYQVEVEQAEANHEQAQFERKGQVPAVPITEVTNQTSIQTADKDLTSARADLASARHDYDAALARVQESSANNRIAQLDLERSRHLVETGAVAQQDFDQHRATADARAADLSAANAAVDSARRRVDDARAKVDQAEARLEQVTHNAPHQLESTNAGVDAREAAERAAQAALDRAHLELSYTRVAAPVAGIVGRKSVNVGDRVQAAQELLAIVQVDSLWVTANFKETQIEHVRPGQRARIHVDAINQTFDGHVESLPGASGARFSLLPPENATGNFVKVVQRLPVRIHLDPNQPNLDRLRPGMSAEPKVFLR
jgi:membrane fusion protein (multidrug efflux system)